MLQLVVMLITYTLLGIFSYNNTAYGMGGAIDCLGYLGLDTYMCDVLYIENSLNIKEKWELGLMIGWG